MTEEDLQKREVSDKSVAIVMLGAGFIVGSVCWAIVEIVRIIAG